MKLKDYRESIGLDRPQAVEQIKQLAKEYGATSKVTYRRYFWWELDVVAPNSDITAVIGAWSDGAVTKRDFIQE